MRLQKETGISRQGVYDLIKRCNKILQEYEEKLHLVEKFLKIKSKVHQIDSILMNYQETDSRKMAEEIRKISGEIIEEL